MRRLRKLQVTFQVERERERERDALSYQEVREELRCSMASDIALLKREEILGHTNKVFDGMEAMELAEAGKSISEDGSLDFQRKLSSLRLHDVIAQSRLTFILSEIESEEELLHLALHSRVKDLIKIQGNRQELIVVASLIGRIPNLAGLARTCEVFKASNLVLADASVLQDRQFQLISVTAELWIPITVVTEANVKEYIGTKKRDGYTLVGLEQTANSISLQKYDFPRKTVLILGREREGIPTDIIQKLDACVEIPQLGVVRSLNVHVSGAIAVWEYTRQQLEKL